mgnify:CR=1 FL=1
MCLNSYSTIFVSSSIISKCSKCLLFREEEVSSFRFAVIIGCVMREQNEGTLAWAKLSVESQPLTRHLNKYLQT